MRYNVGPGIFRRWNISKFESIFPCIEKRNGSYSASFTVAQIFKLIRQRGDHFLTGAHKIPLTSVMKLQEKVVPINKKMFQYKEINNIWELEL